LSALAAFCGCSASNDAIEVCEEQVLQALRSPSTYKRVSAEASPPLPGQSAWVVSISYDADNAFGTPVRGGYLCAFKASDDGKLPTKTEMETAAILARTAAITNPEQNPQRLDVFPCCLPPDEKARVVKEWLAGTQLSDDRKR
jgi:hypothetical protein